MSILASLELGMQSIWPLLLVPVALGLAYLGYRNTTPPLGGRERVPYVLLRTASFTILLLILASPVLNRVRNEPLRPRIAVLIDESASMSTVDPRGDQPARIEQAREVLQSLTDELGGEDVGIDVIPFAVHPQPSIAPGAYIRQERAADGAGTDVVGALREAADRLAGQNLQALVLVSDGRPTRGELDPGAVAGLGRPVHVVGIGDTLAPRDLAIDRCDYGPIAYVESETAIRVRVEHSGFRGRATTLRLVEGGRELFRRNLSFEQEHGRTQVEIPLELSEPGRKMLRLVLDPLDDEITERNNTREIRIEVLKNRLRVLLVAALPDWDVAFLARALRDDPNVDLTLVHQNAARGWTRSDEGTSFTLPRTRRELQEYDLFILGSPGAEPPIEFLKAVAQEVERGRGLLVLPGRESLYTSRGALDALGVALPVQRARRRAPLYRVQKARLTPQGRLHPATSALSVIVDARNVLDKLPPLLARHAELGAKPGAITLLVTEAERVEPVLVAGRFGSGHTVALTGFPLWRWGFTEQAAVRTAQAAFVSHLVRWLTQPRDVGRVQVTTAKPVYEGGEVVEFLSQVLDPQYQPLEDAEVRLEVRRLDAGAETAGTVLLERRAAKPGEYSGSLPGLGPGEYEAEAVAEQLGHEVGRDTTRFTVETYSVEFANTSQDVGFLRELAERTGGRYVAPERARAMARELPRAPQPVLLRSEIEIWNTTPLFGLFVGLLAVEWLLRKRRGLL
ncbi:MAG: hypothetical protein ACE5G2_09935 [Candidatus Krumholzibacteriia bacterium]